LLESTIRTLLQLLSSKKS